MSNIKKIIILLCLIVLTGCAVDAEYTVRDDGTTLESAYLYEYNNEIYKYGDSVDEYIDSKMIYNNGLTFEEFSNTYEGNYGYEKVLNSDTSGINLSKDYKNICSAFNNTYFKFFFDEINCEVVDNKYKLSAKGSYFVCEDDCGDYGEVDEANIKINLPNKAKKQNADEVVEENTYIWHFDNSKDQVLELEFKINDANSNNKNNINLVKTIVILILVVLVIGILVGFVLYNKYKNNKLDY